MGANAREAHSGGLLILLRHGHSMWNRDPEQPEKLWRYAGAYDVTLSPKGVREAQEAGKRLRDLPVDTVFTSTLSRALMTALLSLNEHSSGKTPICGCTCGRYTEACKKINKLPEGTAIPIVCSESLVERSFGDLQGVPSTEHMGLFRKEDLRRIRNSFDVPFPNGESSRDVYDRVIPYFEKEVLPLLLRGQNVLLVSHGFVMRCLIKHLDGMNDAEWNSQMAIEKSHPEECKLLAGKTAFFERSVLIRNVS